MLQLLPLVLSLGLVVLFSLSSAYAWCFPFLLPVLGAQRDAGLVAVMYSWVQAGQGGREGCYCIARHRPPSGNMSKELLAVHQCVWLSQSLTLLSCVTIPAWVALTLLVFW